MGRCERCNLNVKGDEYCPLCGKNVNKKSSLEREFLTTVGRRINKPYVLRVIFGLLILVNFLAIAVELIITKNFYYSWHIIVPSLLVLISIYFPLKKNWGFYGACCICIFSISGYIMFLERFTHTVGWGLNFVVPLFLLASEIAAFLILAITKFEKVEVQLPVFICAILSLVIFLYVYLEKLIYWPAACALLFGFATVFTLFIVKNKRAKKNLQKSFHI